MYVLNAANTFGKFCTAARCSLEIYIAVLFRRTLGILSHASLANKRLDAHLADHIRIGYAGGGKLAAILAANSAAIGADTLADAVEEGLSGYEKEWNINGETVTLSVEKR